MTRPELEPYEDEVEDEEEQLDMFADEADTVLGEAPPQKYKFALVLKLFGNEMSWTIPIIKGRSRGELVEELLCRGMAGDYFKRVLRGIVGSPLPFSEQTTLPGSSYSREAQEARKTQTTTKALEEDDEPRI